jgi:hypothetical protein
MASQDDRHRVYMSFQDRNGWHCQFLERDLKAPLPRRLHFRSSEKVVELVERGGGLTDRESRLMLAQAVEKGRGGIFLDLTEEQYAKLKRYWRQQRPLDLMPQGLCATQSAKR